LENADAAATLFYLAGFAAILTAVQTNHFYHGDSL
tara:strand:- start:232 stop:336 length:105 start_codon:yes stop_codon:yes gene_type:complete